MSRGCRGEKTEIKRCFAPGLGYGGSGSGGGGGSREEAEEEAAATEARTRQKRRRCGFPDKMADGDYLAEPAAPPTCSPAPGILGLVVSQRQQRSESLGPVGFRNRNSQQGVRAQRWPAGPGRSGWVQRGPREPAGRGRPLRALAGSPHPRAAAPRGRSWG